MRAILGKWTVQTLLYFCVCSGYLASVLTLSAREAEEYLIFKLQKMVAI
jgi:hypothetical protein